MAENPAVVSDYTAFRIILVPLTDYGARLIDATRDGLTRAREIQRRQDTVAEQVPMSQSVIPDKESNHVTAIIRFDCLAKVRCQNAARRQRDEVASRDQQRMTRRRNPV